MQSAFPSTRGRMCRVSAADSQHVGPHRTVYCEAESRCSEVTVCGGHPEIFMSHWSFIVFGLLIPCLKGEVGHIWNLCCFALRVSHLAFSPIETMNWLNLSGESQGIMSALFVLALWALLTQRLIFFYFIGCLFSTAYHTFPYCNYKYSLMGFVSCWVHPSSHLGHIQ